jgi:hypothetical protein
LKARYAPSDILSVEQAAAYLDVSEATVRAHCKLVPGEPDRIPNFRMGERAGAIKIPFWGLLGWIAQRSGCPVPAGGGAAQLKRRRMMKARSRRLEKMRR